MGLLDRLFGKKEKEQEREYARGEVLSLWYITEYVFDGNGSKKITVFKRENPAGPLKYDDDKKLVLEDTATIEIDFFYDQEFARTRIHREQFNENQTKSCASYEVKVDEIIRSLELDLLSSVKKNCLQFPYKVIKSEHSELFEKIRTYETEELRKVFEFV